MKSRVRFLTFGLGLVISIGFGILFSVNAFSQEALEVLYEADNWRIGGKLKTGDSLRFDVVLKKQESETNQKESLYRVWSKGGDALVEMKDKKLYGQRVLMTTNVLWFFSPKSKRRIRINPLQRLMGDASYGDISLTRFSIDYEVEWGEPSVEEWQEKEVYNLILHAKNQRATYAKMILKVDKQNSKPLFLDAYARSGKKIKSVKFGEVREINGRNMVGDMTFIDVLRQGRSTIMQVNNVKEHKLSKKYYTKTGMVGRLPKR